MVSVSEQDHEFDAPLETMALAHNLRYPSPYSRHVICSDVISRRFVTPTILRTRRLVLKRGKVPAWAPRSILAISTSWVLEDSEIDLERPTGPDAEVRVVSRNIDHKSIMEVWEYQSFSRHETEPDDKTTSRTVSRVHSDVIWPLGGRVERFGLSRVPKSTEKARAGLALVAAVLSDPLTRDKLLNAGPMDPYPFDPVHSPLSFEGMRQRLDEARRLRSAHDTQSSFQSASGDGRFDSPARDDGEEPGQIWRRRWKAAARRGIARFRENVCALTGFLCDPPGTSPSSAKTTTTTQASTRMNQ